MICKYRFLSYKINSPGLILPLLITLHFICSPIFAQDNADSTGIRKDRILIIGGVSAAALAVSYGLQDNIWWKGEKSSFHFNWNQDWKASLGSDKFGHLYFAYLTANIYSQAFGWAGLNERDRRFYGGLSAMVHQTFTEVRDGFSRQYGFSFGDYAFNLLGAAMPLLQHEIPMLSALRFKISYYPSERFRNGSNNSIIDDYESTYDWISVDINSLLPDKIAECFPDLIDLTVGHSVKNLDINPKHELYIGLDWDLEALPGSSPLLKFLKRNLNLYHFPSPVIKVYPNVVWYGLKF